MPTALLVDDNTELTDILREVLEEQGLACSVASSADEALRALRTSVHPPDFILADLRMPGMPVEELLHVVRMTPAWSEIVFVLMTAGTKERVPDAPFDSDRAEALLLRAPLDDARLGYQASWEVAHSRALCLRSRR